MIANTFISMILTKASGYLPYSLTYLQYILGDMFLWQKFLLVYFRLKVINVFILHTFCSRILTIAVPVPKEIRFCCQCKARLACAALQLCRLTRLNTVCWPTSNFYLDFPKKFQKYKVNKSIEEIQQDKG